MNWLHTLKKRWKLESLSQVVIILVVFACTGFSVLFLKKPLFNWIGASQEYGTVLTILYYIFILPVYNILLLAYGFLFGQFAFFWAFEKKMWFRMTGQKHKIDSE